MIASFEHVRAVIIDEAKRFAAAAGLKCISLVNSTTTDEVLVWFGTEFGDGRAARISVSTVFRVDDDEVRAQAWRAFDDWILGGLGTMTIHRPGGPAAEQWHIPMAPAEFIIPMAPQAEQIDGMTHEAIRQRYALHGEVSDTGTLPRRISYGLHLTDDQLAWAQADWADQLRAKQREAREKERHQVVIDVEWD